MPINVFNHRPLLSTNLAAYDYLLSLAHPGWAWEFLRRSEEYCRASKIHGWLKTTPVPGTRAVSISRMRRRLPQAETWGLCCFRCS
jgi:Family of unknown function (DUF6499)